MSPFSKVIVWTLVGFVLMMFSYFVPRTQRDLHTGLSVMLLFWMILSAGWFIRSLFRALVR